MFTQGTILGTCTLFQYFFLYSNAFFFFFLNFYFYFNIFQREILIPVIAIVRSYFKDYNLFFRQHTVYVLIHQS